MLLVRCLSGNAVDLGRLSVVGTLYLVLFCLVVYLLFRSLDTWQRQGPLSSPSGGSKGSHGYCSVAMLTSSGAMALSRRQRCTSVYVAVAVKMKIVVET